jgi:ATP-dependent DNA helicase RecG
MPEPSTPFLERPLDGLRGVGRERLEQLTRLKLQTIGDLIFHRPRRYEDRRRYQSVSSLKKGEHAAAHGTIIAQGVKKLRNRRSVFEFVLDDGSSRLHCRWWNLPFMEKYFKIGDEVCVYGKLTSDRPRTIDHPETEVVVEEEKTTHMNRIVPIYPLTDGLQQRWLRSLIASLLPEAEAAISNPYPQLDTSDLPERANAVHLMHFPEDLTDIEDSRRRLAFDELIELQISFRERRVKMMAKAQGQNCGGDDQLMKPFIAGLGFQLTESQTDVLREIRTDMRSIVPMRRLLQGDVGAGKTVVAASAILMAIESGRSAVMMAPTEILATQHYENFRKWFGALGIQVNLHTGSRKLQEENDLWSAPKNTTGSLTIGTHALFQTKFNVENLGLVVIDEQHKFGVTQREALVRKGNYPHLLVMTATPIPRTLGLTLYGDLDVSTIGKPPAGRGHIRTFVRESDKLTKVWKFIQDQITEGRQAYVVYPRLEESDLKKGLKAVLDEHKRLQRDYSKLSFGLLHGRLPAEEKNQVMREFADGKIQVLVATSVIEVGVDVANANVMLIENAEQFGLAQLHQLRGRIGRGKHDSYCILIANQKDEAVWERLSVMTETNDGFKIAEEDLRLRGPGDMLGQDQSGQLRFRFANLVKDLRLVERARDLAKELVTA